jgi:hypothetical protein
LEQAEAAAATAPETKTAAPVTANSSAERDAKARAEAERKAQAEADKKRREEGNRAVKNAAPPPVQMPQVESRFPQSKSQRLAELLEKYRRDQLTPAEYHSQRAKILADQN